MAMQIRQDLDPTQTQGSQEALDSGNTCKDFSSLEDEGHTRRLTSASPVFQLWHHFALLSFETAGKICESFQAASQGASPVKV